MLHTNSVWNATTARFFCFFLTLSITQHLSAQVKSKELPQNSIPKSINYSGKFIQSMQWSDNTGDNIIVLSKSESKVGNTDDSRTARLYATRYILSNNNTTKSWTVTDFVDDCPLDLKIHFVDKTLAITDLDKNGKAEVWLMYKVACQGDVSPVPTKIIMYEDKTKYAVRGTTKVKVTPGEESGGEYSFDQAFQKAPVAFRTYAMTLWEKHKIENWIQ